MAGVKCLPSGSKSQDHQYHHQEYVATIEKEQERICISSMKPQNIVLTNSTLKVINFFYKHVFNN